MNELSPQSLLQVVSYAKNKEVIGSSMVYGSLKKFGFQLFQHWDSVDKKRILTLFVPDRALVDAPSLEIADAMIITSVIHIARQINITSIDTIPDPIIRGTLIRMYSNDNIEVFP